MESFSFWPFRAGQGRLKLVLAECDPVWPQPALACRAVGRPVLMDMRLIGTRCVITPINSARTPSYVTTREPL